MMTLSGTVYDPPLPYDERECALQVAHNRNHIGGTMCAREVGFSF